MEHQEVMLENLYQYMVEHGLVAVRLDGFTLYTEKAKEVTDVQEGCCEQNGNHDGV